MSQASGFVTTLNHPIGDSYCYFVLSGDKNIYKIYADNRDFRHLCWCFMERVPVTVNFDRGDEGILIAYRVVQNEGR